MPPMCRTFSSSSSGGSDASVQGAASIKITIKPENIAHRRREPLAIPTAASCARTRALKPYTFLSRSFSLSLSLARSLSPSLSLSLSLFYDIPGSVVGHVVAKSLVCNAVVKVLTAIVFAPIDLCCSIDRTLFLPEAFAVQLGDLDVSRSAPSELINFDEASSSAELVSFDYPAAIFDVSRIHDAFPASLLALWRAWGRA